MAINLLFPTVLQSDKIPDALVRDLEEAVWIIEDGDRAGQIWSDENDYPGYTSYASLDDLPERNPAFADLLAILDRQASAFTEALDWQLGAARLVCDSLWVNILGEEGHHSGHIHPNSVISGTCYIAMPPASGALKFEDPRLPFMMAAPPLKETAVHPRFHYETPKAGTVLMWESWLRHEVMPHKNEAPRLSISFNYSLID